MKRNQQKDIRLARKVEDKPGEYNVLEPMWKNYVKETEWSIVSNVADISSKSLKLIIWFNSMEVVGHLARSKFSDGVGAKTRLE